MDAGQAHWGGIVAVAVAAAYLVQDLDAIRGRDDRLGHRAAHAARQQRVQHGRPVLARGRGLHLALYNGTRTVTSMVTR